MPDWRPEIRSRLAQLRLMPTREALIVEELAAHLDDCYAESLSSGATEDEARRQALAELSQRELLEQELRGLERQGAPEPIILGKNRRTSMIADLWQDLRYGLRALRKSPGFALITVLTLSLGIGANTAIFSFVNAFLLRPLGGVAEPGRLVQVGRQYADKTYLSDSSYPDYLDYRAQNTVLSGLALRSPTSFHLSTEQEAAVVNGELISGNFFDVLGVRAAQGRLITPVDEQGNDAHRVAVISYHLWQQRFGGEANVIGKMIKLDGHDFTVIGVASEEFEGTKIGAQFDVWAPLLTLRQTDPKRASLFHQRGPAWLEMFGRLSPGVTIAQARAEFSTIAERLKQTYPQTNKYATAGVELDLGRETEVRKQVRRFAYVPLVAVGIVLLIACANVAGLLLARAAARQKEIGIRLALGASRARIVRQLLTESLLLALASGAAGLWLGVWLTKGLRGLLPERYLFLSFKLDFGVDWRVFSFTLAVAILTGVLFGLAPAMQASKPDLVPTLKDARLAGSRGGGGMGVRSVLVVGQVALSLVLLILAGLCVRTLRNARAIDTGYEIERLLTARIDLGKQHYSQAQGRIFQQQLLERLQAAPGIEAAGFAVTLPLNDSRWETSVYPEGEDSKRLQTFHNFVSPRYLETMHIPLLLGRQFSAHDDEQSPRVAIINQALARRLWPNENPLGKRLAGQLGSRPQQTVEVIGVARDIKGRNLFELAAPMLYQPLLQNYQPGTVLHLRTSVAPEQLTATLRREVNVLDRKLPVYSIQPLSEHLSATLTPQRLLAYLITSFGLLALLLAGLGLYGLLAYTVAQRTPEIGLRMALGARSADVLRLVVLRGMRLALLGVVTGLAAAFGLTQLIKSLLFGVSATDPLTFAALALLLTFVALAACWVPARRATKVDPLVALRVE